MFKLDDKYIFTFGKLIKSWRKRRTALSVKFSADSEIPKLCVVQVINSYLQLSQMWRDKNIKKQLLLSRTESHQEIQKSSVAGWINTILGLAGLDTSLFTTHSTRSASTSKAKIKGLPTEDILKRGNWSKRSTWQEHYHQFVSSETELFQRSFWTYFFFQGTGVIGWKNSAFDRTSVLFTRFQSHCSRLAALQNWLFLPLALLWILVF